MSKIDEFVRAATVEHVVVQGREKRLREMLEDFGVSVANQAVYPILQVAEESDAS